MPGRLRDLLGVTHKIRERCLYLCTDEEISPVSYVTQTINHVESAGRPIVEISKEQLEFLRSLQFTWKRIAKLLGVSVSTIATKRNIYQLEEDLPEWSQLSDEELDGVVQEIRTLTPNIGERRLVGALRSRGIRIQRRRVRTSLKRVDPVEDTGELDPLNDVQLFALHLAFKNKINESLQEFVQQWQHHPLSTECNLSPYQLFTSGTLKNWNSELTAMDSFTFEDDILTFGIDDYEIHVNDDDYQVSVPEFNLDLDANQIAFVQETLNQANEDGIAAYLHCLNMLQDILNE
eukprot:gene1565-1725_t